ncbi:16S rRNA (guanine(527)-N(7))-methyltransferase RsmG [Leucothrix sargassi]|nr:16S rRNA (guanine(527)-N(7))-methyltransferase RsmG [Leucothrix sargassi]
MSDKLWKLGIEKLDLDITKAHIEKLKHYVTLLDRWNKTYNLTAIRNPNDMIPAHIFDSLVVAPYIDGENCLDVGSGAGLPGIPLSIIQPDRQFTMLDTNGKKTRFIQQAIIELGLPNASVVQSRVAEWKPEKKFDAIISRAFASIADFVNGCEMHLNSDGCIYAMKGLFPSEELIYTPKGFQLSEKIVLEVPYLEGERHLLKILNTG